MIRLCHRRLVRFDDECVEDDEEDEYFLSELLCLLPLLLLLCLWPALLRDSLLLDEDVLNLGSMIDGSKGREFMRDTLCGFMSVTVSS